MLIIMYILGDISWIVKFYEPPNQTYYRMESKLNKKCVNLVTCLPFKFMRAP